MLGKAANTLYVYEPINEDASFVGDFNLYNTCLAPGERSQKHEDIFDLASSGFGVNTVPFNKIARKLFSNPTVIIKEVGGMLLGEWFQQRYGGQVVLLTRHPAPVVLSNMKMGLANADKWLAAMRADPDLYADFLSRYDFESLGEDDVVTKFAIVYCVRYLMAFSQCHENSDWVQVNYEDFCLNPELEFEKLFTALKLDFSESIRQHIKETSEVDKSEFFFGTSRKSRRMLYKWHQECSAEDERKIREVLRAFDFPMYANDRDWQRKLV